MDWQHGVTNAEYSEQVQACAARLVEMVGGKGCIRMKSGSNLPHTLNDELSGGIAVSYDSFTYSHVDSSSDPFLAL